MLGRLFSSFQLLSTAISQICVCSYISLPRKMISIHYFAHSFYNTSKNCFNFGIIKSISCKRSSVNCSGRVRCAIAAMTVVVSTFCFVKPSLNALVLMLWSIPSIAIIHHEAAKWVYCPVILLRVNFFRIGKPYLNPETLNYIHIPRVYLSFFPVLVFLKSLALHGKYQRCGPLLLSAGYLTVCSVISGFF